ncbi:MAG TPA: exosortase E/protease, VPEID-CTERM system, partial [Bryobacteraceae bacterium]|nr:exosortase E/protease, VPEID-CTERM system [Bryobacteraceae bacterium]
DQLIAFTRSVASLPFRWLWFAIHLASAALCGWCAVTLYSDRSASPDLSVAATLLLAGVASVAAALWLISAAVWKRLLAIPREIWAYGAAAGAAVVLAQGIVQKLWLPLSRITFAIVQILVRPITTLKVEPDRLALGDGRFGIIISPECSGLEGILLLLLIGGLWLILFRKECRFPQALLLLPAGALILFLLNSVRIAALILIGLAGAEDIAVKGFHSQAGWISFNFVSLGLCVAAQRMAWFSKRPRTEKPVRSLTEAYLIPFLSILAAGMAARAMSAGFEWAYPLRLIAPMAVFWYYRRSYREIDWRLSPGGGLWIGLAAGALVLALWVGIDVVSGTPAAAMPKELRDATPGLRMLWITLRAVAAIVTVPVAEELAFRGYLIRRVMSSDFEKLPPTAFSWLALIVSSAIFGVLHGGRWIGGVAAGLIYGFVYVRKGRIADSILAHAVTNALLAAMVVLGGAWQYW